MADIILGRKGGGGGGGSPSGPAGGDFTGTYPNPTLAASGAGDLAYTLGNLLVSAGGGSTFGAANRAAVSRVQIGRTGTLRDIAVCVVGSSGNVDVGVYNTASPRARLYSSGSIACPAQGWQIVGDANLAVEAGEQYDFALANDNGSGNFLRTDLATNYVPLLPSGLIPGTVPRIAYLFDTAFPLPATMAEASFIATAAMFIFIARIE